MSHWRRVNFWAVPLLMVWVLVGGVVVGQDAREGGESGGAAPREELASDSGGAPAGDLVSDRRKVVVIPVRENIMPPLVYLTRRAVKDAIESGADAIALDMETNGGRVDVTEEIIEILGEFSGDKMTYVNKSAFSAGAFISVATHKIYMAPQSVIGAAAPIMVSPGGGASEMPNTMEAKMTSAIKAMIRAQAQRYGHNTEVVEAMIDKTQELEIDGEILCAEGEILTLTNTEAEKEYGNPPRRLLSSGTYDDLEAAIAAFGYGDAEIVRVEPTGSETLARWLDTLSPILLVIGLLGLYLEFKTPGFGIPGLVGIIAIGLYFVGGYVGGFSGLVWGLVFLVGLAFLVVEFFVLPGTMVMGLIGAALMVVSVAIAFIDYYPESEETERQSESAPATTGDDGESSNSPDALEPKGGSTKFQQALIDRFGDLAVVGFVTAFLILLLAKFLPETKVYHQLVSETASGMDSVASQRQTDSGWVGSVGVALTALRPSGKARFGDTVLDVSADGELIPIGASVRVDRYRNGIALVVRDSS